MTTLPEIHGVCPASLSAVKDAFAANFVDAPEGLDEQGARFSVCIEGELVVDLWAGMADPRAGTPFDERTLTPVFSSGKAMMALMVATAVERGLLDYERPVAEVWPAYGQAGKDRITLAELMSHQDGLPGFDTQDGEGVDPTIWFDPPAVLERLAAQAPMWPPGTASGYHPITIGYMAGELYRLADGRSMGTALKQDVADAFGLDLWLGLPQSEHGRVAVMKKPAKAVDLGAIDAVKKAAFLDRGSAPGGRGSAEWRAIEIPSANLHATASALARAMGVFANDGLLDGKAVLSPGVVDQVARERIHGPDRVLPFTVSWAAGLMRNEGLDIFGPNPGTLGHCGWGGSCVLADAQARISAAYVMTRQSHYLLGDPRAQRLIDALYAAL